MVNHINKQKRELEKMCGTNNNNHPKQNCKIVNIGLDDIVQLYFCGESDVAGVGDALGRSNSQSSTSVTVEDGDRNVNYKKTQQ